MSNTIADGLRLVELTQFKGFPLLGNISWFDRIIPAKTGVSQEIYRKGVHFCSLYEPNSQFENQTNSALQYVRVHNGDLIYTVHLTPQQYELTEIITTQDGFRRMYDLYFRIKVLNSKHFVESYRDENDPAGSTIQAYKRQFENFFSKLSYAQIDNYDSSKIDLTKLNQSFSTQFGCVIVNPRWKFYADTAHEKELEIQQKIEWKKKELQAEVELKVFELRKNAEFRKEEIIVNAELNDLEEQVKMDKERRQKQFDREEKNIQNEFVRTEKMKYNINEAHIRILSTTVNDLTAINNERIRDAFDSNSSVKEVVEDSLRLLTVFTEPHDKIEEVVDSTLSRENINTVPAEETTEPTISDKSVPSSKNESMTDSD